MSNKICEFEKTIAEQLKDGLLDEKLGLHVKECASCRETIKIVGWMRTFAAAAPEPALPSAGFLFWKAGIIEKQTAGKRAAQPLVWTQAIAVLLILLTAAWLAIKFQTKFSVVLGNLSASFELIIVPFLIAVVGAAFVSLVIAVKWRETERKVKRGQRRL